MRKFTLLLGLLALPFMKTQAQTCPEGKINAVVHVYSGSWASGKEGGIYWVLKEGVDTVAYGGQIKGGIWDTDETTAYMDGKDYYANVCLEVGKTYSFSAYHYLGKGWNLDSKYDVKINGEVIINNKGLTPDDNKFDENYTKKAYKAEPEVTETFTVKNVLTNDLTVTRLLNPINNCSFSNSETFSVVIKNNGLNAQSNFALGLKLDGKVISTDTYTSTLKAGEKAEFTFLNKGDLSAKGIHNVLPFVALAGDEDKSNDTLFETIDNATTTPLKQSASYNDQYPTDTTLRVLNSYVNFCGLPFFTETYNVKRVHIDSLNVEDNWMGKFVIKLVSPSNEITILSKGHGDTATVGDVFNPQYIPDMSGKGYENITFTNYDTAELMNYPFEEDGFCKDASFRPDERLGFGRFNEINPNGLWSLRIEFTGKYIPKAYFSSWWMEVGVLDNAICDVNADNINLEVFPNPANNELNIRVSDNSVNSEYTIINNQGQAVASGKISTLQSTIDIKNLSTGIYFLNLKNNKTSKTTKFSKL